jgi:hypothetical protein
LFTQSQNQIIMFNFRNVFFILSFSTIFIGFITAQPPPPPPAAKEGNVKQIRQQDSLKTLPATERFSSADGRFTISLPQSISGYSALTPKGTGVNVSGSSYQWRIKEGIVVVNYYDLLDQNLVLTTEQDQLNYLSGFMGGILKSLKAELVSSSKMKLEDFNGIKSQIRFQDGLKGTQRTYLVNKRQYSLTAVFDKDVSDAENLINKAFDSFNLISQSKIDEEIRLKIEQSTPAPLPQEPIAKKEKSDAEDEGIKGKVKSVTTESEDLSGTWSIQGRHFNSIEDYNTIGNIIKRVSFDSKAKPFQVTVYGYIDGARVSSSEMINYDSDPPLMALRAAGTKEEGKFDLRYDYKHEYKYVNGKLAENKWIRNNGVMWIRYVYNHKDNKVEKLVYSENGKLNQKYLSILDDKGNEVERTNFNVLGMDRDGDTKYSIKYDSFDEQGNWTKKTTSKLVTENGKQVYKLWNIYYRTITYYP